MNIRRIIREEMDDLQWIKDVDASKFRPKAGDLIEVRNKGNEYAYYNWLGDYGHSWENGSYGYNIQGRVKTPSPTPEKTFIVVEHNTGNVINFPYHENMSKLAKENLYKGLHLEYHPL